MTELRGRQGFALVLAILAVVVVAALIVATHVVVTLDHRVAAASIGRQRAFAASEHALWAALADWDPASSALPPGGATTRVVRAAADSATVTVTRLNEQIYWVLAEASVDDARRRTGMNVRVVADSTGSSVTPVSRSWVEVR